MASLFQKGLRLLSSPRMTYEYACYLSPRIIGQAPFVRVPLGARASARTFSEYRSTTNLMPGPAEIALIRSLSSNSPACFFDIGANVGVWSLMMAKHNPSAEIHAFEPSPGTYEVLIKNCANNNLPNIHCQNKAIAASSGNAQFQEAKNASIYNRLTPAVPSEIRSERFLGAMECTVPTTSLDNYCDENSISNIDFMKIDVEGAEPLVLQGMIRLLKEHRIARLYLEVDAGNLNSMGFNVSDIFSALQAANYQVFHMTDNGVAGSRVEESAGLHGNYLALPN